MRSFLSTALLLVLSTGISSAGDLRAPALTIEANETGTKSVGAHLWDTYWGSYERDNYNGKTLRIIVRDVSRQVPTADVDIYFLGRPLPYGPRFIYAHHHQAVSFAGAIEVQGAVTAPDIKSHTVHLALAGEHRESGSQIEGWIVVGSTNGSTFGIRASNQALLETAQGNPRQADSFSQLLADYEKKQPRAKLTRERVSSANAPAEVKSQKQLPSPASSPRASCSATIRHSSAAI